MQEDGCAFREGAAVGYVLRAGADSEGAVAVPTTDDAGWVAAAMAAAVEAQRA